MEVLLDDIRDISFACIAQGARVDGSTLPSGLKVPLSSVGKWVISGNRICHMVDVEKAHLPE